MAELDATLVLWQRIHGRVDRAIRNAIDAQDGYPSGGGGGGAGTSDRTGVLATTHVERGDRHGELLGRLTRTINELADLVGLLAASNKASAHLQSTTPDARRRPDECESCFRDGGHRTKSRTPGSRLCRWCSDLARHLELEVPPLMLVEMHHQGRRIHDRDIRLAMRK